MAVYLMIGYDINDGQMWQNYPPKVAPILQKHGAKILALDANPVVVEGKPKMMNVIIEFPSEEAVWNCYNDPEYVQVKKLRLLSTENCTMVIVQQFTP